jgi:hypothetical protein
VPVARARVQIEREQQLILERQHHRGEAGRLDLERQHAAAHHPVRARLVLDQLGAGAAQHLAAQCVGHDELDSRVTRAVLGRLHATRPSERPPELPTNE